MVSCSLLCRLFSSCSFLAFYYKVAGVILFLILKWTRYTFDKELDNK